MPGVNGVSRKVQFFEQLLEGVGDLDGAVVDIVGYVGMPTPGSAIDTSAVTHQHRWDSSKEASSVSSKLAGAVKCRAGFSLLCLQVKCLTSYVLVPNTLGHREAFQACV